MKTKSLLLFLIITSLIITGCGGGSNRGGSNGSGNSVPTGTAIITGQVSTIGSTGTTLRSLDVNIASNLKIYKRISKTNFAAISEVSNEQIITFRSGLSETEMNQVIQRLGGRIKSRLYGTHNKYLVTTDNRNQFTANTQGDPHIFSLQNNYRYYASTTDEYYTSQWNLPLMFFDEAWDLISSGPTVIVAVIDSGVDIDHPEFQDILETGRNFVNTGVEGDNNYDDQFWHGTHVAGIIAAKANNSIGIAGAAWKINIKILPVRVLDQNGEGTTATLVNGINWVINKDPNTNSVSPRANIINLSLGGSNNDPQVQLAIQNAVNAGITVIAASGNNNSTVQYPARYPETIAVAALDSNGNRATYSNFGPEIDLSAPGGDENYLIASTVLTTMFNGYGLAEGTSMACPHISALAALLYASGIHDPKTIRTRLQNFTIDKGAWGRDDYYGYGMPDAYAVLKGQVEKTRNIRVFLAKKNGTLYQFSYPNNGGNFVISQIPDGTYYICAFLDRNMDGKVDSSDKFGFWRNPVTVSGNNTYNIPETINLTDPSPTGTPSLNDYLKNKLP